MGRLRFSLVLCRVSASLCLVADCVLEGVVFPLAFTGIVVVRVALQLLVGRVVGRASHGIKETENGTRAARTRARNTHKSKMRAAARRSSFFDQQRDGSESLHGSCLGNNYLARREREKSVCGMRMGRSEAMPRH